MKKLFFSLILATLVLTLGIGSGLAISPPQGTGVAAGGAPDSAHYLTDQSESGLSNEVVVSAKGKTLAQAADNAAVKAILGYYDATSDLDSDLQYLAGFTPTADVKSVLNAADEAAIRTFLDLEAGTDFYGVAAIDTWRASTTVTEMGYVHGLTSDAQGQFDLKLTIANPTFTGTLTVGSAGIVEADLEIIDGAAAGGLTYTELMYLKDFTGTSGTGAICGNVSPQLTTPDLGAATYDSLTGDAVALPQWVGRDSGCPGTDKSIWKIYGNYLSGADGAEDGGLYFQVRLAGNYITFLDWDADTEALTMGDSGTGEDLIWDFETATDNEVAVSTNSGTTQINFNAINLLTTGSLAGRPVVTTAGTERVLTAAECSGGIVLVTAAIEVRLPDVCDSATGAFVMIVQADASEVVQIAVTDTAADHVFLNGTDLGINYEIDSPGTAVEDNYICMWCREANEWHSMGRSGTWVTGGVAD